MATEIERLENKIAELQEKLTDYEKKVANYGKEQLASIQAFKGMKEEMTTLTKEKEESLEQIKQLQKKDKENKEKLKEKNQELNGVRKELAEINKKDQERKKQNSTLTWQLTTAKNKNQKFKEINDELIEKYTQLEQDYHQSQKNLTDKEQELDGWKGQKQLLEEQITEQEEQIRDLKNNLMTNGEKSKKDKERLDPGGTQAWLTWEQYDQIIAKIDETNAKLEAIINSTGINTGGAGIPVNNKATTWGELPNKIRQREQEQKELEPYPLTRQKMALSEEIKERILFIISHNWIDFAPNTTSEDKINQVSQQFSQYGKDKGHLPGKDWDELLKEVKIGSITEKLESIFNKTTKKWEPKIKLTEEQKQSFEYFENVQTYLRKGFTDFILDQILNSGETNLEKKKKILRYQNNFQTNEDRTIYENYQTQIVNLD